MKAARLFGKGDLRVVDVAKPRPGPGEVLIKVAAAGLCHTDLHLIDHHLLGGITRPYTLGHETAGWIAELGAGVTGFEPGEAVLVYGPWGCGNCLSCMVSAENYCDDLSFAKPLGGGLGIDGGIAEYMIVPSTRLLVKLHEVDPRAVAPLSDAGLTPYHVIKRAADRLGPSDCVLVIGIGGLGHLAVQILRHAYPVRIIAADISERRLAHAATLGADHLVDSASPGAAEDIRRFSGSRKCGVVLDFVGTDATMALAAASVGINGHLSIVGLSGGALAVQRGKLPVGARVSMPYWGSRQELAEVVDLYRRGFIKVETSAFAIEDINSAYQKMRNGLISGRAIVLPGA